MKPTEIRKAAIEELGEDVGQMLDAAYRDKWKADGAMSALQKAHQNAQGVVAGLKKELEEGVVDELKGDETAVARYIVGWVKRCMDSLASQGAKSANDRMIAEGAATAIMGMQKRLELKKKAETAKELAKETAKEAGDVKGDEYVGDDPKGRPVGVRPGPTIAQKRKAKPTTAAKPKAKRKPKAKKGEKSAKDS